MVNGQQHAKPWYGLIKVVHSAHFQGHPFFLHYYFNVYILYCIKSILFVFLPFDAKPVFTLSLNAPFGPCVFTSALLKSHFLLISTDGPELAPPIEFLHELCQYYCNHSHAEGGDCRVVISQP